MKKQLWIYCAGGAGCEIEAIAQRVNETENFWSSIRFIDDVVGSAEGEIIRFCDFMDLNIPAERAEFLVANGEPAHRKTLSEKIRNNGYSLATLIAKEAYVAPGSKICEGAILYPYACVSPFAVIGENSLVYYNVSIAHHSSIGKHCVLSMSACVSGHCAVGDGCFIGTHAAVKEGITVGKWSVLGAGSILVREAPEGGVYAGVPARRIRENTARRVFA